MNPQDAAVPFERMSLGVAVIPLKLQRFVANFEANFGGKSPAVGRFGARWIIRGFWPGLERVLALEE